MLERLREKVEEKELIPPNQAGFRKRMGTLNNICVEFFNRQIRKKRGKLIALFIDLKASFVSMNRRYWKL